MCARYADNIAEVILDNINIVDIISEYVNLKRAGRNYKGLCPFHNEKTPSFVVSEDKQLYHCFGCGAAGSAIQFIMNTENLSFIETIEHIADKNNIDLSEYIVKKYDKSNYDKRDHLLKVLRTAAIYYYKNLTKEANPGLSYFKGRDISTDTIKSFGLGYSPEGWNNLMNHMKAQGFSNKDLLDAGLIIEKEKKNGYYDRFRHRVMFPIIDIRDRVIGFGGRVLDDSKPKYLNSPETIVFNKSGTLYGLNIARKNVGKKKQVILVEGYMDVISLHAQGFKNTVASLGTALTAEHGKILARIYDEVIIAFDSDEAGRKAAMRSLEVLKDQSIKLKFINLGDSKDPDEFIKSNGKEAFVDALNKSVNSIEFRINSLKTKYKIYDEQEKVDFLNEAVAMLKGINNDIERNVIVDKLSKDTGVKRSVIMSQFSPSISSATSAERTEVRRSGKRDKSYRVEKALLEAALSSKSSFQTIYQEKYLELFNNSNIRSILNLLNEYYKNYEKFVLGDAAEYMEMDRLLSIEEILKSPINHDNSSKSIEQHILILEKFNIERRIKLIDQELIYVKQSDMSHVEKEIKENDLRRLQYELRQKLSLK